MKYVVSALVSVFILALAAWSYAPAPCCPPPPVTTGGGRTLPRSDRTSPPQTNITLPPTTNINTTGGITQPPTNGTGPVTATDGRTMTRTAVTHSTGMVTTQDNRTFASGGSGRPSATNATPTATRSVAGTPTPVNSTAQPTTSSIFTDSNDAIPTSEFGWEDYWKANSGYLLNEHKTGEAYVSNLTATKDVPRLLTLLSYTGLFEQDIQNLAIAGLQELGDQAVEVCIAIANGKFEYPKDSKNSRMNPANYEEAAIRALGYLGSATGADTVAAILRVDTPNPAHAATKTDELLIGSARKATSREKRFWACDALGRIGDPAYIPVLESVMTGDSDKFVRAAAAEAIARVGGSLAIPSLRKGYEESKSYYQAKTFITASLGYLGGTDPVEDIRRAYESESEHVRVAASWAMAYVIKRRVETGKEFDELLSTFIKFIDREANEDARLSMAMGINIMMTPTLFEPLKKFLADGRDNRVKALAAIAYGYTGDVKAVEYLNTLEAVDDDIANIGRSYGLAFLTNIAKPKLVKDLAESTNPVLACVGMLKYSEIGGDEAFKVVYEHRNDKDDISQRVIAYAATVYGGKKGMEIVKRYTRGREEAPRSVAFVALGIRGDMDAYDEIRPFASLNEKEMKKAVAIGNAMMSGMQLTESLKVAMNDAKEFVRSAAYVSMASLNRPDVIDIILTKIDKDNPKNRDTNYRARAYAIASLANVKIPAADTERVVNALIKASKNDDSYMVRGYAAFMLSMFKENRSAFEAVRAAINDKHTDAVGMAAISLGLFGNPAAGADIKSVITRGRGTPLAYSGRIGLGLLGDRANVPDMIKEFIYIRQSEELSAAAFAIARCSDRNTYLEIMKLCDDQDVYIREYAVKCLGMMTSLTDEARGEVIEKLVKLENDSDGSVRFYAAIVRRTLGDRKALLVALDAMHSNKYYMDDPKKPDYYTLMELVNETLPPMYRMKPYIWGEDTME